MRPVSITRNITLSIAAVALLMAASLLPGWAPKAEAGEFSLATAPGAITWSNDGRYAYFSPSTFTPGSGYIKRLDLSDGTVTDIVTIPDPAGCHGHVTALAITPDDSTLLAGGYSCAFTIPLSNPSGYTSTSTWADWGQQITVGSDAAYIVGSQNGTVYKIRKNGDDSWGPSWTAVTSKGGAVSRSLVLNPSGSTLYVAEEGTDVRVIDTSDNSASTLAGSGPSFAVDIAPDESYLLVLDGGRGLKRIELTGGSAGTVTSASFGADWGLRGISIDSSGTYAYIIANWSKALLKVRTSDLTQVDRYAFSVSGASLSDAWNPVVASSVSGSDQVMLSATAASQIVVFPTTASAPTSLSVSPGDDSAEVTFTASDSGFSEITNYEYRLDGSGSWTALSPVDVTSPVTIPGLTNGTSVSIELRAVNGEGEGTASSSVTVTPQSTPRVPRGISMTPGSRQITIAFSAPSSDGGFPITNYEVSVDGGTTWRAQSPAVTSGPITVTGLTNGVGYPVSLRAVNALGSGTASAAVTVTPNLPASSGGTVRVPDPTPSATPSPTAVPSASPATPATPAAPVALPQAVAVGEGLVVDGRATRVAVKAVEGRKWQVQGEDFSLEFIPQALTGELDGSFTARAGAKVLVRGDGFAPETLIASYLPGALADSLGQSTVAADGSFEVEALIPASLKAGQYVFQVNGLGSTTSVRSVNLGMQLLRAIHTSPKATSLKVRFPSAGVTVTDSSTKALSSFVKTNARKASSALIVPTVRSSATRADVRLARQRASEVRSVLRDQGFSKPIRIATGVRRLDGTAGTPGVTLWMRTR